MAKRDFSSEIQSTLLGRGNRNPLTNNKEEINTTAVISDSSEKNNAFSEEVNSDIDNSDDKKVTAKIKNDNVSSPLGKENNIKDTYTNDIITSTESNKVANIKNDGDISKNEVTELIKLTSEAEIIPQEQVVSKLVVIDKEHKNLGGRPKRKIVPHKKITVDLPADMVDQVMNFAIKDYGDNLTTYLRRLIAKDLKSNLDYYKKRAAVIEDDEWS